jgi:hypothetical protein
MSPITHAFDLADCGRAGTAFLRLFAAGNNLVFKSLPFR